MRTANAASSAPRVLAAGTEQRIENASARLRQAWERFQAYRTTIAELRALTDRQLGDVGLTRATLKETARRAVYAR
jgi:uncharacterized protein YjiS (DUF1127 family)